MQSLHLTATINLIPLLLALNYKFNLMKNIITILLILVTNIVFSQTYPLNTLAGDIPDNAYIKDLNGDLDPYVGTWKGIWEGKTLILQFKKIKDYTNGSHPYYKDRIFGERKIIASNGTIEIDRITSFANENAEFFGIGSSLKNINQKQISFYPKNMCGKSATLDVNFVDSQKTQISLHFEYNPGYINESCQYYDLIFNQGKDWPMNFPKDIVLTKQ